MRKVIPALVIVALAAGVWFFWPREEGSVTTTTLWVAESSSPSSTIATTSSSSSVTPSTDGSHVVETVAEAEEILRGLWFGWFEGIYNQDEDRIREVVVLEETVETARESFGSEFEREPRRDDISFSETEILFVDDECLAVWTVLTLSGFRSGSSAGVEVVRWTGGTWKSLSVWTSRNDLWEADCESSLPA